MKVLTEVTEQNNRGPFFCKLTSKLIKLSSAAWRSQPLLAIRCLLYMLIRKLIFDDHLPANTFCYGVDTLKE